MKKVFILLYMVLAVADLAGQRNPFTLFLAESEKYDAKAEERIASYSEELEKDSLNFEVYHKRGRAFYLLWNSNGRTDTVLMQNALQDFETVLSLNKAYHPAYYFRALLYENTGRQDLAIKDLSRAISNDIQNYRYYHKRGSLYLETGAYNLAKTDLNIAIDQLYKDFGKNILDERLIPSLYRDLAFSYAMTKDFKRAFKDIKTAIRLQPHELFNYLYKGNIYAEKGDYGKALEMYNYVLEKDDLYLVAYLQRGKIYYAVGETEKAAADWQMMMAGGLDVDISKENIKPGF